jgi:hypothetical protein
MPNQTNTAAPAAAPARERPAPATAEGPGTQRPSVDEFLSRVEDEARETACNPSGYSVYHKYSKAC